MKGNNSLHLNQATMIEAMQMWIDSQLPKDTPIVKNVEASKDMSTTNFIIRLAERGDQK